MGDKKNKLISIYQMKKPVLNFSKNQRNQKNRIKHKLTTAIINPNNKVFLKFINHKISHKDLNNNNFNQNPNLNIQIKNNRVTQNKNIQY